MASELTNKQQRFVEEYLIDLNATQAAIRAGYAEKRASEQGYQLLHKTTVQIAIQEAMDARSKRVGINADDVLAEIGKLAFSNMLDYIEPQGNGSVIVDLSQLTRDQAAAISEIVVDEYTEGRDENAREVKRTKFKLVDKGQNLERLGKHLKLFTDRVDLSGGLEITDLSDEELDAKIQGLINAGGKS